jgi:two-component system chemotaxis response regulator CheB
MELVNQEVIEEETDPVPRAMEFESDIAEQEMNTNEFLENVEQIGSRTTYGCPECGGSIWQIGTEDPLRFRCHIATLSLLVLFWPSRPTTWRRPYGRQFVSLRRK